MRLAHFIKNHKEEIAVEWMEYANKYIHPAELLEKEDVRDHIIEMLDHIIDDMETSQTRKEQKDKSRGLKNLLFDENVPAIEHGAQRVDAGFDIVHVSSEFRALRASVLRLWEEKLGHSLSEQNTQDVIRFNEAIDEAWMHSVTRFHHKMYQSKNWFLGILGHDLRNPLTAIVGVQQLLSMSENLDEEEKSLLKRTDASIKRMREMIDNLLELTNIRLGTGIPLNKTATDLTLQCEQILQEFQIAYPQVDLHLHANGPIQGQWDKNRINQVISNLIANAMRYGSSGGPITIKVYAEDDIATFSVHNEGNPIPESRKELIYKGMFKEAGETKSSQESSYGIGLYIVHEITKAHNGTIELESTKEKGTTFKINLPRY